MRSSATMVGNPCRPRNCPASLKAKLPMQISKYERKVMLRKLAQHFKDEEWAWLADNNEFNDAARVENSSEQLRLLGMKLLADHHRANRKQAVLAG